MEIPTSLFKSQKKQANKQDKANSLPGTAEKCSRTEPHGDSELRCSQEALSRALEYMGKTTNSSTLSPDSHVSTVECAPILTKRRACKRHRLLQQSVRRPLPAPKVCCPLES